MSTADLERGESGRPLRWLSVVGWVGVVAVVAGYLLEAIRQRGDCDAGDKSPDTLALSILLIVLVGGLVQLVVIGTALVAGIHRGWTARAVAGLVLPAVVSLAGALVIFVVAGGGPSTWFQYCAT